MTTLTLEQVLLARTVTSREGGRMPSHRHPDDAKSERRHPPVLIDRRIDDFDRMIIDYVLRWLPYGGPPQEDILPTFGILSYELPERVRDIATRGLRANLPLGDQVTLLKAARAVERRPSPRRRPS